MMHPEQMTISGEVIARALRKLNIRDLFISERLAEVLNDDGYEIVPINVPLAARIEDRQGPTPYDRMIRATAQVEPGIVAAELRIDERALHDISYMKDYVPKVLSREMARVVGEKILVQLMGSIARDAARRYDVYQNGRHVGTMGSLPVRSTSWLYDPRPGDFRVETREGQQVIVADPTLGPGDLEAVAGFVGVARIGDTLA